MYSESLKDITAVIPIGGKGTRLSSIIGKVPKPIFPILGKSTLLRACETLKEEGKSVAGYAATSKSTTILNYCGINHKHIDFICDTTPNKINTFTPGTHIPVVPVNFFKDNIPDYTFLLAWNHKKEIFSKEKKILKRTKWFAHVNI